MIKEWICSKSVFYFAFLFGFLLFLNAVFPVQSDDLGASIGGFEAAKSSYLQWNSRLGELFRVGWGAVFATTAYFWFVNAFIGAVVVLELFVLIFARLPRANSSDLSIFCLFFVWLLMAYRFGSMFFWAAGSYNYLWSNIFILAWLLPFRFYFEKVVKGESLGEKSGFLKGFLLFVCGFFAGWGHELSIIFLGFVFCALLFVKIAKKSRIPFWVYPAFLGLIVGFLILFLAPASGLRCATEANGCISLSEFLALGLIGMIERMIFVFSKAQVQPELLLFFIFSMLALKQSFKKELLYKILAFVAIMALCLILRNHLLFLLVGIFSALFLSRAFGDNENLRLNYLLFAFVFFAYFVSTAALFGVGGLPGRAKLHYAIFRFLELLAIANVLVFYTKDYLPKVKIAIFLLSLFFVGLAVFESCRMRYNWEQMLVAISEQKSMGKDEIVVDNKAFGRKFYWKGYGDWTNPDENPKTWPNDIYARYFGVKSFIIR